jgi:hypothetical protein
MTQWRVYLDDASDALFAIVSDQPSREPVDVIPITPSVALHVDRARSDVLRGFSIQDAARARREGFDLRSFGRLVGRPLAEAVWSFLASDERVAPDAVIEVEVADAATRDNTRLNYLFNLVHRAGWADTGRSPTVTERLQTNIGPLAEILRPLNINPDAIGTAQSFLDDLLEAGTEGKAEKRVRSQTSHWRDFGSLFNLIPSDFEGPCADLLVALCFDADKLEDRLNDAIKHAGIHCPKTRAVVFITSKWDPKVWTKLEHDVTALHASFHIMVRGPAGELARLL